MKKTETKRMGFLRRNAVYIILAFCVLAVGLSLTLILTHNNNPAIDGSGQVTPIDPDDNKPDTPDNPDKPNEPSTPDKPDQPTEPVTKTIEFVMPVASATEISAYTETLAYSETLGRFASHKAVDFFCEEGTKVVAVEDGTVESVTKDLLKGVTVVIDHGDGLKTTYNSLAEDPDVKKGQKVKKGDKIGEASVTNKQEYKSGAHLHFEVSEKGVSVDPAKYLSFDEK